jgi:hypothetical protein
MSGILETFFFMFEGDASKVKKGADEGNKSADLLSKTLGSADQAAEKLGDSFKDIIKEGATALLAVASLEAVKSMIEKSAEMTEEVRQASRAAFKGVEDYSAWSNAVVQAGGTADAFGNTMKSLSMRTRTPINYLLRLSDAFKGLSDVRATRLGSWLGIDPGMIHMLQLGRDGITALLKRQLELGVVTKAQADAAQKYTQEMRDVNTLMGDVARRITTALLPTIVALSEDFIKFVEFLRDNKTFTLSFFGAVAAIIAAVYMPAIIEAIEGTLAFLAPWLLIGAAVAAVAGIFALAFNDINAYLNGHNSMLGELIKKYPALGVVVRGLVDVFQVLFAVVGGGFRLLGELITNPKKALEDFEGMIGSVTDALAAKFPKVAAALEALAPIGKLISDTIALGFDITTVAAQDMADLITTVFNGIIDGAKYLYNIIIDGPVQAFEEWRATATSVLDAVAAKFPWLAGVVQAIEHPLTAVAEAIGAAFSGMIDIIKTAVGWILKGAEKADALVQKMRGLLGDKPNDNAGSTPTIAPNAVTAAVTPETAANVATNLTQAQQQIRSTATPVNAMTSNSISNSAASSSKSTQVTIEQIDVNASGQDPNAVNDALSQGLNQHIRDAIDQHQDGIAG